MSRKIRVGWEFFRGRGGVGQQFSSWRKCTQSNFKIHRKEIKPAWNWRLHVIFSCGFTLCQQPFSAMKGWSVGFFQSRPCFFVYFLIPADLSKSSIRWPGFSCLLRVFIISFFFLFFVDLHAYKHVKLLKMPHVIACIGHLSVDLNLHLHTAAILL